MARVLIGIAIAAAALGLLLVATLSQGRFECRACVRFAGREVCRSAAGPDRSAAEQAAVATACAIAASGVTDTIACQGSQPLSLACEGP